MICSGVPYSGHIREFRRGWQFLLPLPLPQVENYRPADNEEQGCAGDSDRNGRYVQRLASPPRARLECRFGREVGRWGIWLWRDVLGATNTDIPFRLLCHFLRDAFWASSLGNVSM